MKVVTFTVLALAVAGCGQGGSNVVQHSAGGQTVTVADSKNGDLKAEVGATATMPTDLPSWTPAYPGSTVEMAQQQSRPTGGAVENVMLSTRDDLTKVTAFYDAKIAKAGVKLMQSVVSADVSTRMAETPAGIVGVTVSRADDGGSTISITRLPKS